MRSPRGRALAALLVFGLAAAIRVSGQEEVHGADSVFRTRGVAVLWAVLKGADDESSQVVINLRRVAPEGESWRFVSVLAVDPFTGEMLPVVEGLPLETDSRVTGSRASFGLHSGRRLLFFRDRAQLAADRPDFVIYYDSIPDTSPELLSAEALDAYLLTALKRLPVE